MGDTTLDLTGWTRNMCITWLERYGPYHRDSIEYLPLTYLKSCIVDIHCDAYELINSLHPRRSALISRGPSV